MEVEVMAVQSGGPAWSPAAYMTIYLAHQPHARSQTWGTSAPSQPGDIHSTGFHGPSGIWNFPRAVRSAEPLATLHCLRSGPGRDPTGLSRPSGWPWRAVGSQTPLLVGDWCFSGTVTSP